VIFFQFFVLPVQTIVAHTDYLLLMFRLPADIFRTNWEHPRIFLCQAGRRNVGNK